MEAAARAHSPLPLGEGRGEGPPRSPTFKLPSRPPLVLTGNPVRPELLTGRPERALATFGFSPARPVVYLTGGARGSHALNEAVAGALPELVGVAQLVHQTGPAEVNGDLPRLTELAAGAAGRATGQLSAGGLRRPGAARSLRAGQPGRRPRRGRHRRRAGGARQAGPADSAAGRLRRRADSQRRPAGRRRGRRPAAGSRS